MGVGEFGNAPKGPDIGPTKDLSELSPEKRAELGDIEGLKLLSEAAPLDPRIAAEEATRSAETAVDEQTDPSAETKVLERAEEGAERLEILREVLDRENAGLVEPPDPIEEEAVPTVEDRQEFMRCILGDKSYEKAYDLFGGMIRVTLRDLTPGENDIVFSQLAIAQREDKLDTEDDWDLLLDRFRLTAGMSRMIWAGKVNRQSFDFKESLSSASEKLIESLKNSTVYRALLRLSRVFQRHLTILMERATDPDFWVVDGPDSPSEPTSEGQSTTPNDRPSDGPSKKESSSDE